MIAYLLKGLIVGLTVAVPVGPVGLMCLENTVTRGKKAGLSCAGGMVLADIFSASVMLFGLGIFYDAILEHEIAFKVVTGLIFAALGMLLVASRNQTQKPASNKALAGLSLSSFVLAVSPATFALMLFLFPALSLTDKVNLVPVVLGVAVGSALWCAVILGAGAFIRKCLGERLPRFKLIVGCIFMLFGCIGILASLF